MSRRRSIEIPGLEHGNNPIPQASIVDNFLISGGIMGLEPGMKDYPQNLEAQCKAMFGNIRRLMEAAGGSTDDIIKVTVYLKPGLSKSAINQEWINMFPDAHSRPARHTLIYDLQGDMLIQCEIFAVLQSPS